MSDENVSTEELILRDHLALDRTRLANERTLLAYLRTALMLMVAGATAERVMGGSTTVVITGWLFIGLGVVVAILGSWRFVTMQQKISGRQQPFKNL